MSNGKPIDDFKDSDPAGRDHPSNDHRWKTPPEFEITDDLEAKNFTIDPRYLKQPATGGVVVQNDENLHKISEKPPESPNLAGKVHDSREHGEQEATPENWTGESRARYWQDRAFAAEGALASIIAYWRSETHHAIESDPSDFDHLISQGQDALAQVHIESEFNYVRYARNRTQSAIMRWCRRAFGDDTGVSLPERAIRMFEEAAELYQAVIFAHYVYKGDYGYPTPAERALISRAYSQAIDVFNRRWHAKPGDVRQEAGGMMVTMNALAEAHGFSLAEEEEREFNRVLAKPQSHWQARQAEKRGQGLVG